MTVGALITKEMKKLELNDAQAHIYACHRIYQEFRAMRGFPEDPKDMLTLYVAYLTAKSQNWNVGIYKKLRGFWKAHLIKKILRQCIRDVYSGDYKSGDVIIKSLAQKIESWL
jgi:hypothetical protein